MKKIAKLMLLIVAFAFVSCSESDDPLKLEDKGLNGKWNLISVSCECAPVNLEKGQQVWYIDTINSKLTVDNNVTEDLHTILESGVYNITINHTDSKIQVLSTNYDFWFRDNDLYLAYKPWVDGPLIQFKRD